MHSCIYEGWVQHDRLGSQAHRFTNRLAFLYLDLSELDSVFKGRWFWSTDRPALAWFRRSDHYGEPETPLSDSIRDLVASRTGFRPEGPIRLLTHPRYFGWVMNPVSFYYCFNREPESLSAVVAEVHNTPWGERHCYVVEWDRIAHDPEARCCDKEFHVSPFMPMDMRYRWQLSCPDEQLRVGIENFREGERCFAVRLRLVRRELEGSTLTRLLLRYPLMTQRVWLAIYWQALRLWWKGCQFFPHPNRISPRTNPAPRQSVPQNR